jgi:hypothetical protein
MPDLTNTFGLSVELHDFSQAQYEEYQPLVLKAARDNYFDFGVENGGGLTANAVVRGATIRAAVRTKILTGITLEDVGKMTPAAATWLAGKIEEHVREITNPPPDPN